MPAPCRWIGQQGQQWPALGVVGHEGGRAARGFERRHALLQGLYSLQKRIARGVVLVRLCRGRQYKHRYVKDLGSEGFRDLFSSRPLPAAAAYEPAGSR